MTRLVIDARPLTANPKGVGRYAYHLCDQLSARLPLSWDIFVLVNQPELPVFSPEFRGQIVPVAVASDLVSGHIIVPRAVKGLKADILLKVNDSAGWNYGVPFITVCHDINSLISEAQESQGMKRSIYQKIVGNIKNYSEIRGLRKSRIVVCNSEFIQKAIGRHYGINQRKTLIGYCGVDPRFYSSAEVDRPSVLAHYGVDGFILTFATGDLRENFARLPEVICLTKEQGIHLPFLIAGVKREEDYFRGLECGMKMNGLQEGRDFLFESFLAEDRFNDLLGLYTTADFYLELSLHEGFGMQLAEAMACGTTCITSRNGALAEVASKFGVFVEDPLDNKSIVENIKSAYEGNLHNRDNREQVDYTKRFSWDRTCHVIANCLAVTAAGKLVE